MRLSGYSLYRSLTSSENSRVLLAIRNDLTFLVQNVEPDDSNEYVAATVRHNQVTFTIITGYIAPTAKFKVKRLQALLATTPLPHLLTGDFNAHHPAWGSVKKTQRGSRLQPRRTGSAK